MMCKETKMNRVAIFAHYDKKNIIDDYVIFYINELQKIAETVIFVSCCDLQESELNKLNCYKIAKKHCEYDFGSYKIGFNFAKYNKLLKDCKEVVFANDSCYGPFKPLDKIFEKMSKKSCDFWGLTKNYIGFKKLKNNKVKNIYCPHIQSYFIVLKSNVFSSKVFENFINSVKYQKYKNDIILKYEIGLTKTLEKAGFKSDFAIKDFCKFNNPPVCKWRNLYEKSDFPFVKCSVLRLRNYLHTTIVGWQELFTGEQIKLIQKNLKYTARMKPLRKNAPRFLKEWIMEVIPKGTSIQAVLTRKLLEIFPIFID